MEDFSLLTDGVMYTFTTVDGEKIEGLYVADQDKDKANFCFKVSDGVPGTSALAVALRAPIIREKIYKGTLDYKWVGQIESGLDVSSTKKPVFSVLDNNGGLNKVFLKPEEVYVKDGQTEADLTPFIACVPKSNTGKEEAKAAANLFDFFPQKSQSANENVRPSPKTWKDMSFEDRVNLANLLKKIGYTQENDNTVVANVSKLTEADVRLVTALKDFDGLPKSQKKMLEFITQRVRVGGAKPRKVKVLGRERIVRRQGRKCFVTYKGKQLGLKEAKALEKELRLKNISK